MQNNKIIIVLSITLVVFLIGFSIFKSTQAKTDSYVDDELYKKPIVSTVLSFGSKASISAGMFRYGDVSLDGVFNSLDVSFIECLIDETLKFTDSQKLLADVNKDGNVDTKDVDALKDYIIKNGEVTYDIQSDNLLYCVSETSNYENCNWVEDNKIEVVESKSYYIFVKNKDTLEISNYYSFYYYPIPTGKKFVY